MPIYDLNRGINKPVEFKGLVGSNIYFLAGGGMWAGVFALNRRYGEHGLMKAAARRSSPKYITNRHSRLFQRLNEDPTSRA